MLADFGFVALFMIAAVLFSLLLIVLPVVFKYLKLVPHHPDPVKNSPFECGMESQGTAWVQFNFRYYFFALMFIALDVLAVFVYPWAVQVRTLGTEGLGAVLAFIGILLIGYLYAWNKKVLQWQ